MKKWMAVVLLTVLVVAPGGGWAAAEGYSATMRTVLKQNHQSHVLTGKVYSLGDKYRVDQQLVNVSQILIIDYFLQKVVLLLPEQKSYVESKIDAKSFRDFLMRGYNPRPKSIPDSNYAVKVIREETLDAHPCEVVQIKGREKRNDGPDNTSTMTYWLAKDLGGLPIKSQTETSYGLVQEVTLHEIKRQTFARDFFSAPVDYARGTQGILGVGEGKVLPQ